MCNSSTILPQRPPLCINSSRNGGIPKSAGTSRSLHLLKVVTRKNVAVCCVTLYSLAYLHRVFDTPATSVIRISAVLSLTTWAHLSICQYIFAKSDFLSKKSIRSEICLDMPRLTRWLWHRKPLRLTFCSMQYKNIKINLIFCPNQ
jgi:hypothetical protein